MAQEVGVRELLEQVNARFTGVEARFGSLETQVNTRFGRVETAIDDLRKEVRSTSDDLRREIHTNFRWIVGIMITFWGFGLAMWGSILAVLVTR